MSSHPPRASTSSPSWRQQQQHALGKGKTPSIVQHNTLSSQVGSALKSTPKITEYPVQSIQGEGNNTDFQGLYQQGPQFLDAQTEVRQSNGDFLSQYHPSYGSHLTPDHGSVDPFSEQSNHTSPDVDPWQENFYGTQYFNELGDDGYLVNTTFADYSQVGDLQGIVPKEVSPTTLEQRSTTPRMSITTTTTASSTLTNTRNPVGPNHYVPVNMVSARHERNHVPDNERQSQHDRLTRSPSAQQHNAAQRPTTEAMNPVLLVSTYNRGDSPARSAMPMARSLSKRSQSSRLSDREDAPALADSEATEASARSSRLMPPTSYESQRWEDDADDDDDDDDDDDNVQTNRVGVAPVKRSAETVPSLNDMDKQRELDETRAGVENWLAHSQPASPTTEVPRHPFRNHSRKERIRSRSTGARGDSLAAPPVNDGHVPGPGVLIDVESDADSSDAGSSYSFDYNDDENLPASPPADVKAVDPNADKSYFPTVTEDSVAPEDKEPLPHQFYRKTPWQDPFRYTGKLDERDQPPTANHAIMQYDRQAAKFETASRAATWGTRRRLSDSEIASIVEGSQVRHLSLSKKTRDRGTSFINRARTLVRRSSSNVKRHRDHGSRQHSPTHELEKVPTHEGETGGPPMSPVQPVPSNKSSWTKPRSPPLAGTSSAFVAMSNHLAAVGGSSTPSTAEPERPKSPNFLHNLKRNRSKSEVPKTPKGSTLGLSELFRSHGGPPVPTLASPMQMRASLDVPHDSVDDVNRAEDDMDEDGEEELGVKMPLPVQTHNIIPDLDGFRTHARQLNPRLDSYLVERISQDQLRRYKKLVKNKIDHTKSVKLKHQCTSGTFCADLGGKPKLLPPRTSAKDATVNYAQFKIGNGGDSDPDESTFTEGVVTPALFPQGIPLPPATHLPAEFECPLCFQVKKFQKPSDWTKHVHEDVQPFSCTFPNCPEPKSFKRKADWVRHENERHRHLEWWKCNLQECAHVCYRKDNFVQHLVREHKMTEPKSRGSKSSGNRIRNVSRSAQQAGNETDDFWQMVDKCRHETTTSPKQEPCKFCNNICSSWKKLSVHVGKHMEQIAMPVLELAAKRAVTVDTVISPIDQPSSRMGQPIMLDTPGMNGGLDALSPYTVSVYSNHGSSSAGHSPVPLHSGPNHINNSNQVYYDANLMQNGMQPMQGGMQQFSGAPAMPSTYGYGQFEMAGQEYMDMPHHANAYTQQSASQGVPAPYHHSSQEIPRSEAMDAANTSYGGLSIDTSQMYNQPAYYAGDGSNSGHPGGAAAGPYMTAGYATSTNDMGHHAHHSHPHSPLSGPQVQGPATQMHVPVSTSHTNGYLYAPHANGANTEGYYG